MVNLSVEGPNFRDFKGEYVIEIRKIDPFRPKVVKKVTLKEHFFLQRCFNVILALYGRYGR